MSMTLSEWRLKMSDNSIAQRLDKITSAGEIASQKFTSLQSKISQTEGFANRASGFFNKIGGSIKDAANQAANFISQFNPLGSGFIGMAARTGIVAGSILAVTAAFASGVNKAAALETSLADLSAITGITGENLDRLHDRAIELGGETGLGATGIVEANKLLASNIDIDKIGGVQGLDKLTQSTITLSKAAGILMPEAADTMAGAINQFRLQATEADRVINVLAAGAKYGAAEIPDLAQSLKITGGVAANASVSLEATVGALEVLSQSMVKGSEAGTGLRNVLLKLQTGNLPGVNLKADGLARSLDKLRPKLEDTVFLAKTFGQENINAAQILISNVELLKKMEDRVTGTSVAFEQAAIREQTYAETVKKFQATWDGLLTKMGEVVLPGLTKLVSGLTAVIGIGQSVSNVSSPFGGIFRMLTPLAIQNEVIRNNYDTKHFVGPQPLNKIDLLGAFQKTLAEKGVDGITEMMDKVSGSSANAGGETTSTGSGVVGSGLDAITGGGKAIRNVTVHIQKLVEEINIHSTVKEAVADIQRAVEEAMIRAVRGTEIAISND